MGVCPGGWLIRGLGSRNGGFEGFFGDVGGGR